MYHVLSPLFRQSQSPHCDRCYRRLVRVNHVQILILPTQLHYDRSHILQPDRSVTHGWAGWLQASCHGDIHHRRGVFPRNCYPRDRRCTRVHRESRLVGSPLHCDQIGFLSTKLIDGRWYNRYQTRHVQEWWFRQSQSPHCDRCYRRLVRVNHVQILILPTQLHYDRSHILQPDRSVTHGWAGWLQASCHGDSRHREGEDLHIHPNDN